VGDFSKERTDGFRADHYGTGMAAVGALAVGQLPGSNDLDPVTRRHLGPLRKRTPDHCGQTKTMVGPLAVATLVC
jgi:hypothetical protein